MWKVARAQAETFSNIKTSAAASARRPQKSVKSVSLTQIVGKAHAAMQPRYWVHIGVATAAIVCVATSSLSHAQALTVKLSANRVGYGSTMDPTATATVAAAVADKSDLLVASTATEAAQTLTQQVALATSDDTDLAKPQVVNTAGNATRDISLYVVQPGDTLSTIATQFGITTDTILWANNLSDANAIKPGQSLTILPVSGLLYTVADGDTADSLAQTYQANAAQIISYNNAEVSGLKPGTQIIIPDGVKPQPVVAAAPTPTPAATAVVPSLTHYAFGGNGYAYGYCTWYVASRRAVPAYWGDASAWYYNAQASGFSVGSVPEVGAIAWTGAGYYGHVAIVVGASGGNVTISEMNGPAGWGKVDTRTVPASSFRYIY